MPASRSRLSLFFALVAVLWAGMLLGVDFVATPAKFLSPLATLPVEIDIGRRTFGVFNRVEDFFAAIYLALVFVLPTASLRRSLLLGTPLMLFALKAFAVWPVLDSDAINVVNGLPSAWTGLHDLYIGLVILQAALLLVAGILSVAGRDLTAPHPPR